MKLSDYIAKFVEHNNVQQIYELTGGMITHLLDSFYRQTKIRIVSMHHEQAAAFAAEGSARITGVPGVALATSGPGAINLLTGIGSCFFDSVPAVFITGQVNRDEIRTNHYLRQLGFQETDIVSMAKPITKGVWSANRPEEVPEILRQAFESANTNRPGPVLIDIPMDVQRSDVNITSIPKIKENCFTFPAPPDSIIEEMMVNLNKAKRPLILAGGGIRSALVHESFRVFIEKLQIPVIHSLMGVDLLPYEYPLRIGMIGTYGNRWANYALYLSDFILVLGSRLDIRQTGSDILTFSKDKTIWHVDVDPNEINNRIKGCHGILCDLRTFFPVALSYVPDNGIELKDWKFEINKFRTLWPDTEEQIDLSGINPNVLIHRISRYFSDASAFVSDVGQHQMWTGQSIELTASQRFLTSGGMGSMGFALPAAIGVAISFPNHPVVVISGDGGFQCNIQELETVAHNQLPIKMIIINNQSLGMVRQFQESYFENRYQSTVWGYSQPDFVSVARAYNIPGRRIINVNQINSALDWLQRIKNGPCLLDVHVNMKANAYPKTEFGHPISEMIPVKFS